MTPQAFSAELRAAEKALSAADPTLRALISKAGPCRMEKAARFQPFRALLRSITHQQLNGKAAETIFGRVKAKFGDGGWPTPERIAKATMPALRSVGLSRAKSLAVKDLAAKTLDGTVPASRLLHRMPDDDIVDRLTQVRGIGRWTVEMMLMFWLGRLDVLPVDDFGVRKGFSQLYGHRDVVKPKVLLAHGDAWRPYRSVASWYMWRVLDS